MNELRVFLSYSHEDTANALVILDHLKRIGAAPMSDRIIPGGARFSEEIRWQISCAHVFVSVLTEQSQRSTWVISELGYAIGVGVPVLPLSLGELPEGLAHELHAVKLEPGLSDLAEKLTPEVLRQLVSRSREKGQAAYECADTLRGRTEALVREAKSIADFCRRGPVRVRQRTAFSSFSLPDAPPQAPIWDARDGQHKRTEEERKLLRSERRVTEEHARGAGCELILDPYVSIDEPDWGTEDILRYKHAPELTRVRLEILREFLLGFPGDDIRVAFNPGRIAGSIVILGDWLSAEAVVPHYKGGYRQTIITRHAPTVLNKIEEFEQELDDCLKAAGTRPEDSRQAALKEIDRLIAKLTPANAGRKRRARP